MSEETIREAQNITSDDGNETLREEQVSSDVTIREAQTVDSQNCAGMRQTFHDYRIVRQLPSTSTEADIFIIEKDSTQYILKLYRYGIEPKNDILQSIKALSEEHPQNFIHVHEVDFDVGNGRWFEIQEYAKAGTLQAVLDDRSKLTAAQQSTLFNDVARQVGESLNFLHQNNLLHLDIKPSNILLRSLNPLDMVLIDFGIATSLASDMSKKFTQTRGTPMYQSPESYTGGMGRPSDWWGLGMILLEIAAGAHPFKGLNANTIAYSVATEPVNIPESLDEGQRELFHGLLTRNPEKRWNWDQVYRWLKGERGIPQYFEASNAEENSFTPINFMGQQYRTPSELAAAFIKNEESWEKGRAALMRGEVSAWARNTKQMDLYAYLMEDLAETQDADEKLFLFVQKFGARLPFVVWGHQITFSNLLLFTGKALKREPLSAMEQKIVDAVQNGRLLDYSDMRARKEYDEMSFQVALGKFKDKPLQEIVAQLDFYVNPQEYYCPFVSDTSNPHSVILESSDFQGMPISMEKWSHLNKQYILPNVLVKQTHSAKTYISALDKLDELARQESLLTNNGSNMEKKKAFADSTIEEYIEGVYEVEWGIKDSRIIKEILNKFRKEVEKAQGLRKKQLTVWICYLDMLLSRKFTPIVEDSKIIKVIKPRFADAVQHRLLNIGDIYARSVAEDYASSKQIYEATAVKRKTKIIKACSVLGLCILLFFIGYIIWVNSNERFFDVCRFGSLEEVKSALKKGWDVNAKDHYGINPLMFAILDNPNPEVAKFLIESGADPNAGNPLLEASRKGYLEVVEALITAGANINVSNEDITPLKLAAENGRADIIKVLANAGADPNVGNPLLEASRKGYLEVVEALITAGADINMSDGDTTPLKAAAANRYTKVIKVLLNAGASPAGISLIEASKKGYFDIVKSLLAAGSDVNMLDSGTTAITVAVENGNEEIVKILLDAGANLSESLLVKASRKGYPEIVKILIASGADVNADDHGITPLSVAIENRHTEIAKILLNAGANPNQKNFLFEASRTGNIELVKALIAAEADVNVSFYGSTPLTVAVENNHADIVKELLNAGAVNFGMNIRELIKKTKNYAVRNLLNEKIRSRSSPTKEEIMAVAKKYDFEDASDENKVFASSVSQNKSVPSSVTVYLRDSNNISGFTDISLPIAKNKSGDGTVYLCSDSIIWQESFFLFAPYIKCDYSTFRNDPHYNKNLIYEMFSKNLSGELLNKTVNAFIELTY